MNSIWRRGICNDLGAELSGSEIILFNEGDNTGIISCGMDGASMEMNGFEVFRFTNNKVPKLIENFLNGRNLSMKTSTMWVYTRQVTWWCKCVQKVEVH